MEEKEPKKKDRVLGDEWLDWDGSLTEESPDAHKSLFFVFAAVLLGLFVVSGYVIIFMISPRLEQVYQRLPQILYAVHSVLSIYAVFTYVIIALALLTNKRIWLKLKKKNFLYNSFVPMVIKVANYFGISQDKISNSFIKVNNAIVTATIGKLFTDKFPCGKILVLLPRCLQKDLLKEVINLKETYDIDIHTVPGGTQARAIIKKTNPRAIIGVACERDLLSGIKDVATKIPVIGVVNQRPHGPCKDTLINLTEVEDAIKLFSQE